MKTSTGFEFELASAAFGDMEVLDLLVELESGDTTRQMMAVSPLLTKILSPDGKKRLYDHVRDKDGRVPVDRVVREVGEILAGVGDSEKKS